MFLSVFVCIFFFFFFSSRRRHTRCGRDWSSDVCSSDLAPCSTARKWAARRSTTFTCMCSVSGRWAGRRVDLPQVLARPDRYTGASFRRHTMSTRQYSLFDRLLVQGEQAMRTLVPGAAQAARPSPAQHLRSDAVAEDQRRHVAGLMRINHTGEVCAQALYQGQALTAKL